MTTLGIGAVAAVILLFNAVRMFGDYGGGGWMLVGWAFGVFLSAATSACILDLLANIDESLEQRRAPTQADRSEPRAKAVQPLRPGVPTADFDDPDVESKRNFSQTSGRS